MKKFFAIILMLVLLLGLGVTGYAASGEASAEVEDDGIDAAFSYGDGGEQTEREQTEGFAISHYPGGAKTEEGISGFLFQSEDPTVNFFFSEKSEDTGEFFTLGGEGKNVTIAESGADITPAAEEFMEARGVESYDSALVLKDGGQEGSYEPAISAKGYTYLEMDGLLAYVEGEGRAAVYSDAVGGSTIPGMNAGPGGGTQPAVTVFRNSLLETTGASGSDISGGISFGDSGGRARGIQPQGKSLVYLYDSVIVSRTWGAYSTDSAKSTLDLVSYNSMAYSNRGYGAYADTSCHLFLYGSEIVGGSDGVVASNNGEIYGVDTDCELGGTELRTIMGTTATRDVSPADYLEAPGEVLPTIIRGGSTAVQFHMPDMGGSGARTNKIGTLYMDGGILKTEKELEGDISAYNERYSGACIVTKSTQANVLLIGTEMESHNGELIHAMINSDTMANNIADGDVAKGSDYVLRDMTVEGDVVNDDYQRALRLTLDGTELTGGIFSRTCEDWNAFCDESCEGNYKLNPEGYESFWGVELTLTNGAVWNVTESSTLAALTVEDGTVNGTVTENADGTITVEPLAAAETREFPLNLSINGQEVLAATVAGEVEGKEIRLDLGGLLDALGLGFGYDEETGAVSLETP